MKNVDWSAVIAIVFTVIGVVFAIGLILLCSGVFAYTHSYFVDESSRSTPVYSDHGVRYLIRYEVKQDRRLGEDRVSMYTNEAIEAIDMCAKLNKELVK